MSAPGNLVTVYRSMDATAQEDCELIVEMLSASGVAAVIFDDEAPGVVEGTFEVRVAPEHSARAEKIIAENPLPDEVEEVDPSPSLDLETVFHSEGGATSELQALGVKGLLESNGIAAVLVGDSVLPNLPFEVRVAHDQVVRATQLINEAENTPLPPDPSGN